MVDDECDRSSSLGLAIIGCGQIVTHHLAAGILPLKKYEVRALCDPSQDRCYVVQKLLQSAIGSGDEDAIRTFASLDSLIDDKKVLASIDVCFIAVPHDLHEPLAALALSKTNCTVVLEKPLAITREACDNLVQLSHKTKRLVIAEQSPYWQEVQMAKELIHQDDAIGTIVSASAYYYESMRDNVTSGSVEETGGLGWRGLIARAGGGIAVDGGLHWIRPIREMCDGRITKVIGIVRRNLQPELQMEGESLGHALFEIDTTTTAVHGVKRSQTQPQGSGPLVATYSCNMLATAPMAHDTCPYFRITGTKGEIVIHGDGLFKEKPGAGGLRLYTREYPNGKECFSEDRVGGFFLGFAGLWRHIHDIVSKSNANAAHETVVRASDDVRVVLALYKSSETGQWESTSE